MKKYLTVDLVKIEDKTQIHSDNPTSFNHVTCYRAQKLSRQFEHGNHITHGVSDGCSF